MNPISFLLDPWIASIFVFMAIIGVILWRDRNNIEREGIIIVRRTKKGLKLINSIAKKSPKFWKVVSTLGVFLSIGVMVMTLYLILNNVINVFFMSSAQPALSLVLPTYSTNTNLGSGISFIPFWYWIIGLATVVVVHEMMHGIVGRAEDFPLKSVGWAILGILPAAFVEPEGEEMLPDEKKSQEEDEDKEEGKPWAQGSWIGRLRVLAAGSFSNITFGVLIFALLVGIVVPGSMLDVKGLYDYEGVTVTGIANQSPAYEAGIRPNMTIMKFNGVNLNSPGSWDVANSNISLNQSVEIVTSDQRFKLVPRPEPERNYSYNPAPIDYFLVSLEKQFPGAIEVYEENNDLLVPENKFLRKERWVWIENNYPSLLERADARIRELEEQIPDRKDPWIGIESGRLNKKVNKAYAGFEGVLNFLTRAMFFIFVFNLGIGAANMLPIKPLDGGYIIETLTERFKNEKSEKITLYFSYATLGLIVMGFVLYYSTFLLGLLL